MKVSDSNIEDKSTRNWYWHEYVKKPWRRSRFRTDLSEQQLWPESKTQEDCTYST